MIEIIYNFLIHTPLYVYLIFSYLIYVGFKATKSRVTSIQKSLIMPILFLLFSLNTILSTFHLDFFVLFIWVLSLFCGIVLSWLQVQRSAIKVDKNKKLIFLPGSWTTLAIILLIFFTKYYFGYKKFLNPTIFQEIGYKGLFLFISGLSSGLFVGKVINYFYRLKKDPHCDLEKTP